MSLRENYNHWLNVGEGFRVMGLWGLGLWGLGVMGFRIMGYFMSGLYSC